MPKHEKPNYTSAKEELLDEIYQRLYNPGRFVERGEGNRPGRQELLDSWKLRAIEELFEVVDYREKDGKYTIVCRTEWKSIDPDQDLITKPGA